MNIAQLEAALAEAQAKITALDADLLTAKQTISTITADRDAKVAALADSTTLIGNLRSDIEGVRSENAKLSGRVSELEAAAKTADEIATRKVASLVSAPLAITGDAPAPKAEKDESLSGRDRVVAAFEKELGKNR